MPGYTIVTGATGLLGGYLLRDLLLDGERLAVVVRPSEREDAAARIEAILQKWEHELAMTLPRPVCLAGDVTQPWLGLDPSSRKWVARHCRRMLHNAAMLKFEEDHQTGEPWRTNVEGTRHAVHLCERLGIGELHYVSTAYVCGRRPGRFMESDFDLGQEFRNVYEHSKFQAEQLVRQSAAANKLDRVTIYRPTVIAGDSRTGYTSTYHGLYMYLHLIAVINRNTEPGPDGVRYTPVRLRMTGQERRNIVPVDWVASVICRLMATPAARGRTFHLAPNEPLTPRDIIECGYRYFNSRGVEFLGPEARPASPANDMERASEDSMAIYEPYEQDDPEFDMTELNRFAGDQPCPRIDDAMLRRYWRYGEKDRWGKRRTPPAHVPLSLGKYLQSVLPAPLETAVDVPAADCGPRTPILGLDATGPGGGQWTLFVSEPNMLDFEPGLPAEDVPTLHLTPEAVAALPAGDDQPLTDALDACELAPSLINGELLASAVRALVPGVAAPVA
jgi:thioester reductase-like protein